MDELLFELGKIKYAYKIVNQDNLYSLKIADYDLVNLHKNMGEDYIKLDIKQFRRNYDTAWVNIISRIREKFDLNIIVEVFPPNYYFANEQDRFDFEIDSLSGNKEDREVLDENHFLDNKINPKRLLIDIHNDYDFLMELIENYFEDENLRVILVDKASFNLESMIKELHNKRKEDDLELTNIFELGAKFYLRSSALAKQLICFSPSKKSLDSVIELFNFV